MIVNLWFFLSVVAVVGVVFAIFVINLDHKKKMKILEIEASMSKRELSLSNAE
ncbi:MAG: hypothetical protein AAF702_21025 [Chloroflexota bacterium]